MATNQLKLRRGDVVIIRQNTNGQRRTAQIDEVTKGGRVVGRWIGHTNRRGDFITKATTIDPSRETIERKASREQREVFLGMLNRIKAEHSEMARSQTTDAGAHSPA